MYTYWCRRQQQQKQSRILDWVSIRFDSIRFDSNRLNGRTSYATHNNEDLQTKQFAAMAAGGGNLESKNKVLQNADCRLSTLKKGDAVLFDARVLHCGNANDVEKGSTRVLFNFSFRNPEIQGNLGYPGSIRPGYCGAMALQDVTTRVDAYNKDKNENNENNNAAEPFAEYGDGLLR